MGRISRAVSIVRHALSAAPGLRPVPGYVRLFRTVLPYTMVGLPRLAALARLSRAVEEAGMEGAVVECGTCNGGTAGILAATTARSGRPVWLFDSFEGLPEPTEEDGEEAASWAGRCAGREDRVRELLEKLGQRGPRIRIVKGWFQDTLEAAEVGPVALLHVDADWYESVALVLERFYDEIVPGGYVVLDDYGHWPGCRRAVDEFLAGRDLAVELVPVDYTGVWFRKPGVPLNRD